MAMYLQNISQVGAGAEAAGFFASMMTMILVFGIIGIALYVYSAIVLMTIAKKTKTEPAWLAWIPIANLYLFGKIPKQENLGIALIVLSVLSIIPIIGALTGIASLVIMIYLWCKIAVIRGKPEWWGFLMIIPIVNLVIMGILAWSD